MRQTKSLKKPAWIWGMVLFGLLLVFQGALRKWFLPGFSSILYLAKDGALAGVIILFISRLGLHTPGAVKQTSLQVVWKVFAFIVVLQAFNIHNGSLLVGLLGIKSYLLYTSLLVLVPVALNYVQRPYIFIRRVVCFIMVPVLLLGIYQFFQPIDSWINRYVSEEMNVVGILGRPRIAGTFSYIGGMSSFLVVSLFMGVGLVASGFRFNARKYKLLGVGLLFLALITAPMNGSRSVIYSFFLPLPLVFYILLKEQVRNIVVIPLVIAGFLGVFSLVQSDTVVQGWETINYRIETASDRDSRIQSMLMDPVRKLEVGGVLGYGAGATHQGAGALSSQGRVDIRGVYYEGELGRVIIELGIIGALFYLGMKVLVTWIAWQAMYWAKTPWESILSITSFSFLFVNILIGTIVFNHITGAIYWLWAGCGVWVWQQTKGRQQKPIHR